MGAGVKEKYGVYRSCTCISSVDKWGGVSTYENQLSFDTEFHNPGRPYKADVDSKTGCRGCIA